MQDGELAPRMLTELSCTVISKEGSLETAALFSS